METELRMGQIKTGQDVNRAKNGADQNRVRQTKLRTRHIRAKNRPGQNRARNRTEHGADQNLEEDIYKHDKVKMSLVITGIYNISSQWDAFLETRCLFGKVHIFL